MVASWLIVIIGILISALYLYYNRDENSEKKPQLERGSSDIPPPTSIDDKFELQYEQISEAMHSRESTTIVGGTILITASLILLSSALGSMFLKPVNHITRLVVVSAALAIYIVWLLCINLTSNLLDNICYSKLREMEQKYNLEIHSFVRNEWKKRKSLKFLRRHQWLWLLWVLISFGIALLLLP